MTQMGMTVGGKFATIGRRSAMLPQRRGLLPNYFCDFEFNLTRAAGDGVVADARRRRSRDEVVT